MLNQKTEISETSYLVGNTIQWFEYISFELSQTAYYSLDILNIQLLHCSLSQMKNSDYLFLFHSTDIAII